jgi:selenide,water dikinase
MFDPQTCGGLLAAVPASAAPALLARLPAARIIGTVTAGPPHLHLG